jgi:hypothetical protein
VKCIVASLEDEDDESNKEILYTLSQSPKTKIHNFLN